MKKMIFFPLVLGGTLALAGCSSSDDKKEDSNQGSSGSSGSSGGKSSSGGSSGKTEEVSQNQTCEEHHLCLNGVCKCTDGKNKDKSCCVPDPDEGTTCRAGTECESVCKSCS